MSNDLEPLMAAVSPGAPSGCDLEYDADFSRMEKAAQGTPDQEFGSTRIEGTPADWDEVRAAALGVLRRSKDLRAATYLAQAELATGGFIAFRDVLHLISVFVDQYWDTVYPQLDADDDNDPTIRINSLAGLCKAGGLIRQIRHTPILVSRSVGKFTLTDSAIAKGELPIPEGMESPPTQKKIEAAVMTSDSKEFSNLVQSVEDSLKHIAAIEKGFSDRLGAATGPNLETLEKELKGIARFHKAWTAMRKDIDGTSQATSSRATGSVDFEALSEPTSIVSGNRAPVGNGPFIITRREDVIEGLDKIIAWLERNEPSSPLPMLLKRAKRLSTMSFMDILRDISPDGVTQAEVLGGPEPEPVEATLSTSSSNARGAGNASKPVDPNDGY